MKLAYALILTCILTLPAQSQTASAVIATIDFYEPYDYYHQQNQREKQDLKKNKVQSRTSSHRNEQGKLTKTVETFDEEGNLISYEYFDEKKNLVSESHYVYNDQYQMTYCRGRYKNKVHSARIAYNDAGAMTEIRGYNIKGEYYGKKITYNGDGKVASTLLFRKDSTTVYKQLDYEYYADKSLKTIHYFEKGELKYTWVYDCKPEGEMLGVKTEDTTRVCIKEEVDANGNRVVWRQEFNRKGEPVKVKTIFDKDSSMLYWASFDAENRLKRETTFFKDGGEFTQGYDKKGNSLSTYETLYNSQRQMVKKGQTYKKWFSTYWYSYNNSLLATSTYLSKRAMRVTEFQYTFFN